MADEPQEKKGGGPKTGEGQKTASTGGTKTAGRTAGLNPGAPGWRNEHTIALTAITLAVVPAGLFLPPVIGWAVTMALLTAFLLIAGHGVTTLWFGVLVDDRNMASLSRLQMALWTILVLSGFLAAALHNLRVLGTAEAYRALAISIPSELWLLMGISTTSMVASPLIRSTKRARAPRGDELNRTCSLLAKQRGVDQVSVTNRGLELVNGQPEEYRFSDVVRGEEAGNGAHLDLSKVQNLFFTLILVIAYGAALATQLGGGGVIRSFPALDGGLVTLLAISHGGYLTFKAIPHSQRA